MKCQDTKITTSVEILFASFAIVEEIKFLISNPLILIRVASGNMIILSTNIRVSKIVVYLFNI